MVLGREWPSTSGITEQLGKAARAGDIVLDTSAVVILPVAVEAVADGVKKGGRALVTTGDFALGAVSKGASIVRGEVESVVSMLDKGAKLASGEVVRND